MLEQIEIVDNVTDANVTTPAVTDAMIEEMNADLLEMYRAIDAQADLDREEDDRVWMATCDLGSFTDEPQAA